MKDLTMGQRIAEQRKKLGLSQEALGEKMNVSRQAISKWESDGAVPEVDKLIALSRLFGVSVGWLLGVEEQTVQQETSLSETQLKTVEEIIKKYHTPPLITKWQQILGVCVVAAIFLCLFAVQITNAKQDATLHSKADSSIYNEISVRLSVLEAAVLNPGEQLLAEYSIDVSPKGRTTESGESTAHVAFQAIPKVWVSGDTGYLCVSGGNGEAARTACTWDGTHLSAAVDLEVSRGYDKYELCFVVEHESGSQEQQILQNDIIDDLANAFSITSSVEVGDAEYQDSAVNNPANTPSVEMSDLEHEVEVGDAEYQNGTLILKNFTVRFDLPSIYSIDDPQYPSIVTCEYLLQRRPLEDSAYVTQSVSVMDYLDYEPDVDETHRVLAVHHFVTVPELRFENVDIEDCDHLRLNFHVTLSNGMDAKIPVTILIPDGNGGLE